MIDTHFACDEQLKKLGGKTPCCGCSGHLCKSTETNVEKTEKSIHSSEPM